MSDMALDEKLALAQQRIEAETSYEVSTHRLALEGIREARELLAANMTPGFICTKCGGWTGIMKMTVCRFCGEPRKGGQR